MLFGQGFTPSVPVLLAKKQINIAAGSQQITAPLIKLAATAIYVAICVDGRGIKRKSSSKRSSALWKLDMIRLYRSLKNRGIEFATNEDEAISLLRNGYIHLRKLMGELGLKSLEELLTSIDLDDSVINSFCKSFAEEAKNLILWGLIDTSIYSPEQNCSKR